MEIIKVDATTSTNSLARILNKNNKHKSFCVSAEFQSEGRGQLDSTWQSTRSENLMFTIVFNQLQLNVNKQFLLNALVCLNLFKVLKKNNLPDLSLKWPNDILSEQFKICGILIENTLSQNMINNSYVGIGLNVNQTHFENLPQANSLKNLLNKNFDRFKLLKDIADQLENIPKNLQENSSEKIINSYKDYLYKFNTESRFYLPNGEVHSAVIKDIALDGQLLVKFKSGKEKYYHHKEISQQY